MLGSTTKKGRCAEYSRFIQTDYRKGSWGSSAENAGQMDGSTANENVSMVPCTRYVDGLPSKHLRDLHDSFSYMHKEPSQK